MLREKQEDRTRAVTKQEEVQNMVVKAGSKSHLLYMTVIGGHRYLD